MLASPPTSSEIPDDKFDALLNLIQRVEAGEKNDLVRCWRGRQHQRKNHCPCYVLRHQQGISNIRVQLFVEQELKREFATSLSAVHLFFTTYFYCSF
jgi:hypothetical protein